MKHDKDMSAELTSLMNSNSPMASPIAGAPQQGGGQQNYASATHRTMQQQQQYAPDEYDESPPSMRAPAQLPSRQASSNVLSSLLDDPDKKVTLVVLALLVLAQHSQTREFARTAAKTAGFSLVESPYENIIISSALAAGFYYFLINYM